MKSNFHRSIRSPPSGREGRDRTGARTLEVLWATSGVPRPAGTGASIRDFHLIREMAALHRVSVLALVDPSEAGATGTGSPIFDLCETVELVPRAGPTGLGILRALLSRRPLATVPYHSPEMARKIAKATARGRFDLVQIEHSFLAPYRSAVTSAETRTVLSFHNVAERQYRSMTRMRPGAVARAGYVAKWLLMRGWESRLAREFDACVVVSSVEARALLARGREPRVAVVENGVDTRRLAPLPDPGGMTISFVGNLRYAPNLDAVRFFCSSIFPGVRAACPDARFVVVGRDPLDSAVLDEIAAVDGVVATGTVPDVVPYYRDSAIVVAPLRAGGGTRLKILEAMALGRPVVSTSIGCEGLAVLDGETVLVRDTPVGFGEAVVSLLVDPGARRRLAANARSLVERRYDWSVVGGKLADLYTELAS